MSRRPEWRVLPDRAGAGPEDGHCFGSEEEALAAASSLVTRGEPWLVFRVRAAWSLVQRVVWSGDAAAAALVLLALAGFALVDVRAVDAALRGWL